MKAIFSYALFFILVIAKGQAVTIEFNKEYPKVQVSKESAPSYSLNLEKGQVYRITVLQQGIDVQLILKQADSVVYELDSPNGKFGREEFDYTPGKTAAYILHIQRLEENGYSEKGEVTVFIKKFTKKELKAFAKIKKELEPENRKNFLTLDIDHFWQAFDALKNCKSHKDSVQTIQTIYLDRATDGLKNFIKVREFAAEKFVEGISKYPKFYQSVRSNTYKVKEAEPYIQEVFDKFKQIYPGFKPFKVCFAIGVIRTGGTVSNNFVLIGTEIISATKNNDFSEFDNPAFVKVLAKDENNAQNIKDMIAHECVHTQQKIKSDSTTKACLLLYKCMLEGFSDFIGELISSSQINKVVHNYGNIHEKELWAQFKNELCSDSTKNWLYGNYKAKDKDKPADLGYYIGYKIAQSYYNKATDKKQAIADIIELKNPLEFLEKSGYDKAPKK